jgi:hypothetical protein
VWKTGAQPPKCHISHVVLDSSWEEAPALTLESHPLVISYAKNQALGFDIPYLDGGVMRRYVPDFLVRLDIGGDEPLNLILEVKGIRDESDKAKAQTTRDLWVPGVNALGGFGRWHFEDRDCGDGGRFRCAGRPTDPGATSDGIFQDSPGFSQGFDARLPRGQTATPGFPRLVTEQISPMFVFV